MRNPIRVWRQRRTARADYRTIDSTIAKHGDLLAETTDPSRRARSLRSMAELTFAQSTLYPKAFGPRHQFDDDGWDVAETLLHTSMLYRVLTDVEHIIATKGRAGRQFRFRRELGDTADDVVDEMAAAPDFADRRALLKDLADAVRGQVGPQSIEVLRRLPSPGYCGWRELAASNR